MRLLVADTHLSSEQLMTLPRCGTSSCWRGVTLPSRFEWCLACDETSLWFLSRVPGSPWFNAAHSQGSFVEGLWEDGDVAELFLSDGSGRYQEFNVSPTGAWWACHFNSYRERSSEQSAIEPLFVEARRFDSHWEAVFAVKREHVPFAMDITLRAHVSGIVQKPRQTFLSSLPVEGIEPDFHHSGCFQPVGVHAK